MVPFCSRNGTLPSPGWPPPAMGETLQSAKVSGSFGPNGFSLAGNGGNWLSWRSMVKSVPLLPTYATLTTKSLGLAGYRILTAERRARLPWSEFL